METVQLRLAGPLLVLAAWFAASSLSEVVASVMPSPLAVVSALLREAWSGALITHIGASLGRAALGYAAAAVVGISLGFAMGIHQQVRALLSGPVELLRPVSSIAWIPLAILWFGIGIGSAVFVVFIICVFTVLLSTIAGVLDVDEDVRRAALTLGAKRRLIFFKITIPSALPKILLGLRVALSGAWGGVLVAEMIAARSGVGHMMHHAQMTFNPSLVIGGMVVIGLVGYLLNAAFLRVERRLVPYAEG